MFDAAMADRLLARERGEILRRKAFERAALDTDGRSRAVDNNDGWISACLHRLGPL